MKTFHIPRSWAIWREAERELSRPVTNSGHQHSPSGHQRSPVQVTLHPSLSLSISIHVSVCIDRLGFRVSFQIHKFFWGFKFFFLFVCVCGGVGGLMLIFEIEKPWRWWWAGRVDHLDDGNWLVIAGRVVYAGFKEEMGWFLFWFKFVFNMQ